MTRVAGVSLFLAVFRGRYFMVCLFLSITALFLPAGCANSLAQKSQASGVYHIVKKGETLYSISRAYSISLQDLAEINNIEDVAIIRESAVIFIPHADQVIEDVMVSAERAAADTDRGKKTKDAKPSAGGKASPPSPAASSQGKDSPALAKPLRPDSGPVSPAPKSDKTAAAGGRKAPVSEEKVVMEKGRFAWPVRGDVKTRFGIQPNKTYHNWIKIVCPEGTGVKAAAGGTVIFSANLKGFSETVIIRHANDFATVYTHLGKRSVRADQDVGKGQIIGYAGRTDEAGETYLHFEIRLKGKARNPLFYLP